MVRFNNYTIYARFFPCIVSALPLFILWFFLSTNIQLKELGAYLLSLKFYGGITLSIVFLYFYAQMLRITSKIIQKKLFLDKTGLPTTYLMTYADHTFSKNYKDKYRELIKKHFGFDLLNEDEEISDATEARMRLNEATKQVILKVKDGQLVKKQNIWYGFVRNLIGGTIFSMIFCVINLVVGLIFYKNLILIVSSIVLLVLYWALFLFRKQILIQNAEAYANQLIAEFISQSNFPTPSS